MSFRSPTKWIGHMKLQWAQCPSVYQYEKVSCTLGAHDLLLHVLALFPGLLRLQFSIACSMQKPFCILQAIKNLFAYCKRSKTFLHTASDQKLEA